MERRFIRDGVLDEMIQEVKKIMEKVSHDKSMEDDHHRYINSLLIHYETAKISLERIEESIERARKSDSTGEITNPLCEAASHIKTGIMSQHEILMTDIKQFPSDLDLKDFL